MDKNEVLGEIAKIIDEVNTAVLGTVDQEGKPDLRWMTPVMLRGRANALFTVTFPQAKKVRHILRNNQVQWLFQTKALDTVVTVEGRVNLLENPSIRNEVLEAVGPRLHAFWKVTPDERDLMVMETVIERAVYYKPMKGLKVPVEF